METLKYTLKKVTGSAANGKECYKAEPAEPRTIEIDDFVDVLAKTMHQSTTEARFMVNAVSETIQNLLNAGFTVKLDLVKFKPTLTPATFNTVDADLSGAKISGAVVPTRKLHAPLRLAAENVLKIPHLSTYTIYSRGVMEPGHIFPGIEISYTVDKLKINLEREDEGIFLENSKGDTVAKARITKQDGGYLLFFFDDYIEPGDNYRISYRTRHGKDSDHALITQHWDHKVVVHKREEYDALKYDPAKKH